MDPNLLASLVMLPLSIYGDRQNLSMQRNNLALNREQVENAERDRKFQRLITLMQESRGAAPQLAGYKRLMGIRNAGAL